MKDVRVLVKDVQTGESFSFGQIAECARHFNLSQSTVSNRIKNGVLTGRRWLFENCYTNTEQTTQHSIM